MIRLSKYAFCSQFLVHTLANGTVCTIRTHNNVAFMDAIVCGVDRNLAVFLDDVEDSLGKVDLVDGDQLEEYIVQHGSSSNEICFPSDIKYS
jgi:hypothetical protein